ncbi:hypothetical protein [Lishizhenia sp.]|uniref:hypothetical protein n=1 Tax=Lishizhenia sp. TaxID=2497594 RepID=UPI00299EBC8A|nr:hypothetical protein [Lishizhenia sp.]MDX1444540.1 hypothetical protein [Lishizhenia sp.]
MKNSNLLVVSFLLLSTASIAQLTGDSKPKFEMKRNHIQFELGTGSGKIEDKQLSIDRIKYSSVSAQLGYEHHLKNDFRFQFYLSNDATKLKQKSEGLDAPYVAFESSLGFLAPVVKTKGGFNMHLGASYAFSTRFANWEKRNLTDGNFSSLTAHHLNVAMQFEYKKDRWRTTLGLNMPIMAHVYRSTDPTITIVNGEFSPLFENGKRATPKNYKVPEARLMIGYKVTNFLELNLNYDYKQINSSFGADIKQVEHQVRMGIVFNF